MVIWAKVWHYSESASLMVERKASQACRPKEQGTENYALYTVQNDGNTFKSDTKELCSIIILHVFSKKYLVDEKCISCVSTESCRELFYQDTMLT